MGRMDLYSNAATTIKAYEDKRVSFETFLNKLKSKNVLFAATHYIPNQSASGGCRVTVGSRSAHPVLLRA